MHSGDSACVLPAPSLTLADALEVEHVVKRLGPALGVVGLLNVQLAIADATVYVLEANPRASRTVPVREQGDRRQPRRCRVPARRRRDAAELDLPTPRPTQVSVKAAVLPFARFPGADPVLGPEMRSTGEVMASAADLPTALAKAERAAGRPLPTSGTAFLSVRDERQAGGRRRRGGARGARLRARRDRGHGARRCARRVSRSRRSRRSPTPTAGEATVVDLVRERPLRPRRQHAAGKRRPRRRLPHPRGGARRARAVRHDDLRAPRRPCTRSRTREPSRRSRSRSGSGSRRDAPSGGAARRRAARASASASSGRSDRPVHAAPARARRRSSPGRPGSSSCSRRPGGVLPRPMSLCLAPPGELALPHRPDRARARARSARSSRATRSTCSARSATASTSTSRGRCSSAAGSGSRRCRTSSEALGRSAGAPRVPDARTTPRRRRSSRTRGRGRADARDRAAARRSGRRARLRARADARGGRARSCPGAQLAWEAPMACGYGACYGCVVERDGHYVRLCVDGPVLRDGARRVRRRVSDPDPQRLAAASTRSTAPEVARHARRLRDEDGHAASARGEPAAADRRDRARDAQLDRAPEPRHRRVRRATHLPRLADARRPALGLGRRVLGRRLRARAASASTARPQVATIELNLSCPNVEEAPETAAELVAAARAVDVEAALREALAGDVGHRRVARARSSTPGADGLSLVNTIRGLALDPATLRPRLARGAGGYSGPALRPIALACVYACAAAVDVPIVGMGGVSTGQRRARARRGRGERGRARDGAVRRPGAPDRIRAELGRPTAARPRVRGSAHDVARRRVVRRQRQKALQIGQNGSA